MHVPVIIRISIAQLPVHVAVIAYIKIMMIMLKIDKYQPTYGMSGHF